MSADELSDQDWPLTDLQPDLQVWAMRPMPALSAETEAAVAAIWQQQRRTRPRLFNGAVFSADRITAARIDGHWTEYRRVLAQMRDNGLYAELGIRALAVHGLLECADGVVLGRREPGSVYQPGGWQSPPAGSVERRTGRSGGGPVDLPGQILAECEEELGIQPDDVVVSEPVVAVAHPGSHVVDIGLLLRTPLTFARIETAWRCGGNREYDRLRLLTPRLLAPGGLHLPGGPDFAEMLPTTRALLRTWLRHRPAA